MSEVRVLFVCLGNICRSPSAQGVFQHLVDRQGLGERIAVDSAGTGDWHIGQPPDLRSQQAALARGYAISDLRARLVTAEDFRDFDYILAMDRANLRNLLAMQPEGFAGHLGLFLEFGRQREQLEVPDPYHGGEEAFELVLDLIQQASEGLLEHIRSRHLNA